MLHRSGLPVRGAILALLMLCPILARPAMAQEQKVTKAWAISEFGEPIYDESLTHWPYANPDAPKGGRIVLGAFGSFDSFNLLIVKGQFPSSVGLTLDSLMVASGDDLLSGYGSIAESAEYPEDKSWIIFNLRPEARFADGVPITAEDFKFALDAIKEHGRPLLKSFWEDLVSAEVLTPHRIKFNVATKDSMKALMAAASMSPRPRHFWQGRDPTKTLLDPPTASGAYEITAVDPGRSITYSRVKDYWAADLPVNKGLNNFDEIHYEHYRDETVMFEAFKAGEIDFRGENSVKRWMTSYDFKAFQAGKVVKREIADESPRGIGAYFFNHRRPQFADARVRQAIILLYDFESLQRTLLFGKYQRIKSYFPNSDYGASGPPTPEEVAILEPFRDQLPEEVLTQAYEPPKTDGSGRIRANLRKALKLFEAAGYGLEGGKLHGETGQQLGFEIITGSPETERLAAGFISNLRRAGIDANLRLIDPAQWRNRIESLDFDIYSAANNFFPPPGNELHLYFGSEGAFNDGKGNRMGYKNPVADALIDQIVAAKDLETLKATSRALDRVLLWGHNVVPLYLRGEFWVAYWNKFGFPERRPKYATGFPSGWWIDPALESELNP